MQIRKSQRTRSRIRLALQGPSGSGKTYSALLLALGLTTDLSKVCIIDTEHGSADLYSDLGDFSVINPDLLTPEAYVKAIEIAEQAGMEVCIIDSLSHSWEWLLEYHSTLSGNSFANWSKVTPRHRFLIQKILTSSCHIIATLRVKQEYVISDKGNGKMVPEKLGLKAVQRDGVDYEFTTVFDLDMKHYANCTKDRTGLFIDQPEFVITRETGAKILAWCDQGSPSSLELLRSRIQDCESQSDLMELYNEDKVLSKSLQRDFRDRKLELEHLTSSQNPSSNGHQ